MSRSRCGPKNARNWSSSNPARSPKAVRRCKQGRSSGRGTPIPVVVFHTCGRRWMRHCDLAARLAHEVMRHRCPRESRGRRESRVPVTPAVVRKNAHGGPQVRRNARLSLRDGFTAYAALSPEPNSSGLRRRRIGGSHHPVGRLQTSASLTPATGARTTRFCRPQLP